jgi:hypothetical protein
MFDKKVQAKVKVLNSTPCRNYVKDFRNGKDCEESCRLIRNRKDHISCLAQQNLRMTLIASTALQETYVFEKIGRPSRNQSTLRLTSGYGNNLTRRASVTLSALVPRMFRKRASCNSELNIVVLLRWLKFWGKACQRSGTIQISDLPSLGISRLTRPFNQVLDEKAMADPCQPSGQRANGGLARKVSRIASLREAPQCARFS